MIIENIKYMKPYKLVFHEYAYIYPLFADEPLSVFLLIYLHTYTSLAFLDAYYHKTVPFSVLHKEDI